MCIILNVEILRCKYNVEKRIRNILENSMKRKYLILDVDGTLTNSKKEITDKTYHALIDIQKKGHKIVIASGRPTPGIKWIVDKLELREYGGYALCFNGAKVIDFKTGDIIYQNVFPRECIAPLYEYALAHDMGMITYEGDTVIHGTRADEYMRFEAGLNFMELKYVEDFANYVTFDVNKCLFTAGPSKAPALEKEMAEMYKEKLSIYRSEEFFIEAMPLGVDKAASLDRLFTAIGADVNDTVAVGDGFNDMSMIRYAKVGVCMKNGQQAVKDAADYITEKTNDEDGIVEVIERFIDDMYFCQKI